MNKTELAGKIKLLEGLTEDEKSALLGLLHEQKKYGLVWEDKPEDVEQKLEDELPVLKEVKERAIISDDPSAPNHILIEGDNLHALTALTYTHQGKIDVIYIDPPYNRGKKDFKYNDLYVDEENPFKHSLWLSFMSKRLHIAKGLLSSSGVMIIHIDEHEFDALNILLSTEIFSSQNNLGMIIWNKLNPKGDSNAVATQHEYILVYCKNKESFTQLNNCLTREKPNAEKMIRKGKALISKLGKNIIPDEIKEVIKPFNYSENVLNDFKVKYNLLLINLEYQSWLKRQDFSNGEMAYKYIDGNGDVFRSVSMAWPNKEVAPEDYWTPLLHPITGEKCPLPSKGWRYPQKSMEKLLNFECSNLSIGDNFLIKGKIVFTLNKNGKPNIPERKYLLKENMFENTPSIFNCGSSDDNLFADLEVSFPYPKCLDAAKYLLKNVHPNPKIILDFFAGSGTTLHATLELNKDGGRRQCILVTNNENNICEEVTYMRSKKVIQGYTTPKGEEVEGLKNNTLRYYRTDFVPREQTNKNKRALMAAATDLLCIKNDVYTEQNTFGGRKLKPNAARYFDNGKTQMLLIYNELAVEAFASMLKEMEVEGKIKIYVFSNNRYAYNDNFENVLDKVELCALPAAIYDAYKKVLKPQKVKENVSQESISEEYVFEKTQGEIDFSEEGGEQ